MIGNRLRRRFARTPGGGVAPSTADEEAAQIQRRYQQWRSLQPRGRSEWPPPGDDIFGADVGVPEIPAAALNGQAVIAGVQHHGALIVRGLLAEDAAAGLRGDIDRVLDLVAARNAGQQSAHPAAQEDVAWRRELADPATGELVGPTWRAENAMFSGEASVVDSPHVAVKAIALFQDAGISALAGEYLGEPPAVSLEKWTMRRVPPTTNTSWHQDGFLLGAHIRSLNLWIALSDCGVDASGLDIVGKRINRIVETGTAGAYFHWDVGTDVVARELGDSAVLSPVFRPGDAVFFDQFLLHRTGVRDGLTKDRYALETWFFAPSHFPADYHGVMV